MKNPTSPSVVRTKLARISKASYQVLYARVLENGTSIEVEIDRLLNLDRERQLEMVVTPTAIEAPPADTMMAG